MGAMRALVPILLGALILAACGVDPQPDAFDEATQGAVASLVWR